MADKVRIYRPSKTAMQAGRGKTKAWVMEFVPAAPKVTDPLIGWVGSRDTRSQVMLRFHSLDEAVAHARRMGYDYTVIEPKTRRIRPKSYAENFRYDRVE